MKMIDSWTIIIILSNLLHIFGILFEVIPDAVVFFSYIELTMGLGTFLIWISLLKYFQYSQDYYILPATMMGAGQTIIVALVSVFPIIVGVAFFCMTEFGMVWRFNTLDKSIIMLWAIMNGDELQNIFLYTKVVNFLTALIFCYCWVWFGNNFITPFFLAINEDGYLAQKRQLRYQWLENTLDDPGAKNAMLDEANEDEEEQPEHSMDKFLKRMRDTQFIQLEILQSSLRNEKKAICIQDII